MVIDFMFFCWCYSSSVFSRSFDLCRQCGWKVLVLDAIDQAARCLTDAFSQQDPAQVGRLAQHLPQVIAPGLIHLVVEHVGKTGAEDPRPITGRCLVPVPFDCPSPRHTWTPTLHPFPSLVLTR